MTMIPRRVRGTQEQSSLPVWEQRLADEMHARKTKLASELLLPKAMSGERSAALRVLQICAEAIADRSPIAPDAAAWLANVLWSLGGGKSIENAAGIPARRRGEKSEAVTSAASGRRYIIAREYGIRRIVDRQKEIVARIETAELFGVTQGAVRDAWANYKDRVPEDIERELSAVGKVFRLKELPADLSA